MLVSRRVNIPFVPWILWDWHFLVIFLGTAVSSNCGSQVPEAGPLKASDPVGLHSGHENNESQLLIVKKEPPMCHIMPVSINTSNTEFER